MFKKGVFEHAEWMKDEPISEEDGLAALIASSEKEIENARARLKEIQQEARRKKTVFIPQPAALSLDNADLGEACKSTSLRQVFELIGDVINVDPFIHTPAGSRVVDLTLAEVFFYLRRREDEERTTPEEEPAGHPSGQP